MIIKNCPWYFTAHNQLWGNKDLHMFNEIGAISKSVYDSLINGGKKNVVLINNGINTTQIKQKQKWFKNMSVFRIVQVSRLTVWFKGQDLLIKAAAQLVRENIKDFHIDLIGEGEDYQLLNNMISEMKMEQYVTLLGNQTREYIYNQLANYDLYIQASRNDGFALSVAEAMVAKVPVLVSNIYGPKILVEDGKYGTMFKSEDVNDLVKKIKYLKNNYPTKDIIEQACNHITENYTIAATAKKYINRYKMLIFE